MSAALDTRNILPFRIVAGPAARPRSKSFPTSIERGLLRFKVSTQYRGDYIQHTLNYTLNGIRRRIARAEWSDIERAADAAELAISNQQTNTLEFSEADRLELLALREARVKAGCEQTPLLVLITEACESRQRAASRTKIVAKPCPEIVAELIAQKQREKKVGGKWLRNLEAMLNRFATHWPLPLSLVRAADINSFLRELNGGLVYRRHHRSAVNQLVHFARSADYLPRDWDEMKHVDDPDPAPVKTRVWEPKQLRKLLAATKDNMIPFTVCQAFAGVRHEEICPESENKVPLDWQNFDWEQKHIEITEETGKTGARIIPMCESLIAWLTPFKKPAGRICTLRDTPGALAKAKRRAGLPAGLGESRNVLRKSFGSYRLAIVKQNFGQVAGEMGNSVAKIKSNYHKPKPEREGKAWFDIWPEAQQMKLL